MKQYRINFRVIYPELYHTPIYLIPEESTCNYAESKEESLKQFYKDFGITEIIQRYDFDIISIEEDI